MSIWRRLYTNPSGAIPGALFTRIGVAALALLCGLLILTHTFTGEGGEEAVQAPAQPADLAVQRRAGARLAQLADREQQRRALASRQKLRGRERRQAAPGALSAAAAANTFPVAPGQSDEPSPPPSEAELQLREQLRLEDLRRRHDSLRSEAVAHSYRASESPPPPEVRTPPAKASEAPETGFSEVSRTAAAATKGLTEELDRLHALAQAATQAALAESGAESPARTVAGAATSRPARANQEKPETLFTPNDPKGFERIHEGSFLEAALVTQLSGDFPGPVLAQVSVPFYSRDRQRVLIPRGSRVIGTAQAVVHRDQSRLAVSFHRLILPSGRWIALKFQGLNQVGESALTDRVDRHYVSMFAAAGAVGVLAGLTLQGSHPYAGGLSGFRAGAGQGLGTASTSILDRFLNRFPNITIRAGHRLRIWLTADVLAPRPTERNMNP